MKKSNNKHPVHALIGVGQKTKKRSSCCTSGRVDASKRGTVDSLDDLAAILQPVVVVSLAALAEEVCQLIRRGLW